MINESQFKIQNQLKSHEVKGFKKRTKLTLILNSHSLSYYQKCEKLYEYTTIRNLEQIEEIYPFTRGSLISKILELWYRAKKLSYSKERLEDLEFKLYKIVFRSKSLKEDDRTLISARLQEYFEKYRLETYKVIAVEKGFSKILYEDDYVLYIYEGKPDLVVDFGPNLGIGPIDHKSESRRNDIYPFNNQILGYCWSMDSKIGMYNYIGLQNDDQNGKVLRRETLTFSENQINQWRDDTIQWFHRILRSLNSKNYLRSWNCQGVYGVCSFSKVCEMPTENGKLVKIKNLFKEREPYRSW